MTLPPPMRILNSSGVSSRNSEANLSRSPVAIRRSAPALESRHCPCPTSWLRNLISRRGRQMSLTGCRLVPGRSGTSQMMLAHRSPVIEDALIKSVLQLGHCWTIQVPVFFRGFQPLHHSPESGSWILL